MKNIKENIIVAVTVLLAIGAFVVLVAGMETQITANPLGSRPRSEAILISFKATYGPAIVSSNGSSKPQIGMEVAWCSPSSGAPQVPDGFPAGETIAYLSSLGYQIQWVHTERIVAIK